MKTLFASFALCFLVMSATTSAAQEHEYSFNRVPLLEENMRGFITGIAQDANGYMWFTGVNLYRYDGYHVITYKNNPLDSNSISPSRLESIAIDHKGIIWIGTFGSGLDRFDPVTGIFKHYPNKPGDPSSLSNNIVTSIVEDNDGILWVATHGGLNRMDQQT
jgi:ligand-binding sensor domain-containing protein